MAIQLIDIGAAANDGQGDPLRTAFGKCNDNFSELYSQYRTNPPTTSIGSPGDQAGMYSGSSTYFYYCIGDYDGSTDIWYRTSGSSF